MTSIVIAGLCEEELAARFGSKIDRTIAPGDEMYCDSMERYLHVAYSGLSCIGLGLAAASASEPRSILDLPCGYGRMLRLLQGVFPDAQITAADLNRTAVDFCVSQFGVEGIYSETEPSQIPLGGRTFDLIWCGSLLTHLDADRWAGFLDLFCQRLNPGGVAVFTTHGQITGEWLESGRLMYGLERAPADQVLAAHRASGFGYANYAWSSDYGVSLSAASWVIDRIAQVPGWRLVAWLPRAWDDHQDVWACQRT